MSANENERGGEFDPIAFLERAVQTPSHEDPEAMRSLLVDTLGEHGVEASVDDAGTVLATRTARYAVGEAGPTSASTDPDASVSTTDGQPTTAPHVLFNTHIDTVSPHVSFSRDDEAIYGRGACDAKGPLAAMLAAFLEVDPSVGRTTLAITPDEEARSTGAAALVERFDRSDTEAGADADTDADANANADDTLLDAEADSGISPPTFVVVGEPTGLDVCTAAKGRFEGTITLFGERAHAAEPRSGRNAVAAAGPVLSALASFDALPETPDEHPLLGSPTLTPTVIRGGDATNQIPARCEIVVDRRSVPPETADGFEAALSGHLAERLAAAADRRPEDGASEAAGRADGVDPIDVEFRLTERETPFLEAFETPADRRSVDVLRTASGGRVRPFTAATEASYFAREAPTVVFGPGVLADEDGPVAHADREYVRVGAVEAAAAALRATLAELLG